MPVGCGGVDEFVIVETDATATIVGAAAAATCGGRVGRGRHSSVSVTSRFRVALGRQTTRSATEEVLGALGLCCLLFLTLFFFLLCADPMVERSPERPHTIIGGEFLPSQKNGKGEKERNPEKRNAPRNFIIGNSRNWLINSPVVSDYS